METKTDIRSIIQEEVEAYFAVNGETGGWGESMRDSIGVDLICDNIQSGHSLKITDIIRAKVEKQLYTVWVGGTEVNENYIPLVKAKQIAKQYKNDGHDDVVIEEKTNQKIVIPMSEQDCDDIGNGEHFDWTFDGIDVHIKLEDQSDLD